jgi:hypothetical protein
MRRGCILDLAAVESRFFQRHRYDVYRNMDSLENNILFSKMLTPYTGKLTNDTLNLPVIPQPVFKITQQTGRIRAVVAVCKTIISPEPIFFTIDEPRILKCFQMLRNGRLGYSQCGLNLTDTHDPMLQYFKQFYPVGI